MAWVSCQTKLSYKYRRRTHTVTPSLEESYLRVDVSCGSDACDSCQVGLSWADAGFSIGGGAASAATVAVPTATAVTASLSASAPYYLIPDALALSDLLELFELPDISNYIILASCVRQVALQSGRKATRLRALYRDRRRRAVLFDDVHCLDTAAAAAGADPSLPPVLAAGLYYARHLGGRVPLVVVSDRLADWMAVAAAAGGGVDGGDGDEGGGGSGVLHQSSALADNLAEAVAAGVTVLSAAEYVAHCWPPGSPVAELYDSITAAAKAAAAGAGGGGGEVSYMPHLSQQEVEEGLAAGELLRGVVHVSRRSPTEAVVELGHGPDTALGRLGRVSGRAAMNRAMEGDVVAVRLLLLGGPAPDTAAGAAEDEADSADAAAGAAGAAAAGAAASAAAADTDYGAELLGDPEGNAAGGEEGALAMLEADGASGALPAAEVVAILQRDPRDIVACLSMRDEARLRARLEQQQQQLGTADGGGGGGSGAPQQRRTEALVCMPLDRRLPAVVVVTRQGGQLLGSRFVVRVDSWQGSSRYPRGHVTRVLGRLNDLRAESEAVLVQCGIHYKPFCEAALAELPRVASPADWRVPPAERAARRDLTGPEYFVVSIDPVGCTDVDDAMHVRFLPPAPAMPPQRRPQRGAAARRQQQQQQEDEATGDGGAGSVVHGASGGGDPRVEVGVHIADVSWFVAAGGMLDGEARDRCTSVYLVDRRLDMLPGLLSEQLCSLRQGVERLAVSVVWTLRKRRRRGGQEGARKDGRQEEQTGSEGGREEGEAAEEEEEQEGEYEVEDVWFGRTVIRSRHQLHYQQAQDTLDGRPPAPGDDLPPDHVATLRGALRVLDELAGQLHARRVAAGALELASAELRFRVDEVTGAPCQVVCKPKIPMMDVVAEMMIAANSAVAHRIATAFPGAALLRNHPPPRAQAFGQVRALLEPHAGGAPIDPTSNASLAAALDRACAAAAAADPAAATLIKSLATRAMSEAQYSSSGTTPPGTPLSYHYGLALQYYTHFTSPIRRYADVVVHRQLLAALYGCPPPQPHPDLAAASHTMNVRHRQAKAAQKECSELYLLLLLHSRPHVERALVCGVSGSRLELFIPSYQLRGAVALTDRRGLPRPPLRPGQSEDPGAEEDAFTLAERRQLRLATTPDSATITDTSTGTVVWSVRLWQPVSVRLAASDHRAHGPKLAMRLLDPTHPDALPLTPAAVTPVPIPTPAPAHGARRPPYVGGAGIGTVPASTAGGGGGGAGGGVSAALPPHLRLLMGLREKATAAQQPPPPPQQEQATGQAAGAAPGGGGSAAVGAGGGAPQAAAAAAVQPGQQATGTTTSGPETEAEVLGRNGGHGSGAESVQAQVHREAVGSMEAAADAVGGLVEDSVLGAPAAVMVVAAGAPQLTMAAVGMPPDRALRLDPVAGLLLRGSGSDGLVQARAGLAGDRVSELRAQLKRVSRLEMRLLACKRGSTQERKIRERLDELTASVRNLHA